MNKQTFVASHEKVNSEIVVKKTKNGAYLVTLDGVEHVVDAHQYEGGTWSLIIDNSSYDVELELGSDSETDGEYTALVRGSVVELTVQDERRKRLSLQEGTASQDGPQTITSPMPGKVVKILVEEGQEVEENSPVIVIEAMKMENELRAIKSGIISKIMVSEAEAVEGNAKLLIIS